MGRRAALDLPGEDPDRGIRGLREWDHTWTVCPAAPRVTMTPARRPETAEPFARIHLDTLVYELRADVAAATGLPRYGQGARTVPGLGPFMDLQRRLHRAVWRLWRTTSAGEANAQLVAGTR